MPPEDIELEYVRFAVLDRPLCVVSPHLSHENLEFLRGVDPEFFLYQAAVHQPAGSTPGMDNSDRVASHAALSLRLAYGQAVEALFAFLAAVVQAPDCVFGWLSAYRSAELVEFVERVRAGRDVKALAQFRPTTWRQISEVLLEPLLRKGEGVHSRLSALFAKAWGIFAEDFTHRLRSREYNSLKHSFRVQPTAFKIEIQHEGQSLLVSNSPLGHRFPYLKPISDQRSYRSVGHATMSLQPARDLAALRLIALSINNAVSFARVRAGDTSDCQVLVPDKDVLFEALWERDPETLISSLTHGDSVRLRAGNYLSDADILAVYDDAD